MSTQLPASSPSHSRQPSVSSGSSPSAPSDPYAELARLSQLVAAMQTHMQRQDEFAAQQSAAANAASSSVTAPSASASRLPKIAPPPKFKGEMGVQAEHWVSALQQQFDYYDREFTTETAKVRFGVAYLDQGTALKWYQSLPSPKPATWDAFVTALRARFSPVEASMVARVSLGRLRQGERNSVGAYTNSFQNLMTQIVDMTVTDQVFHYVTGLLPSLRVRVWEKLPKTLAEAIGYAASYEATIGFAGRAGGFAASSSSYRSYGNQAPSSSNAHSSSDFVPMDINHVGVEPDEIQEPPRFHEEPSSGETVLLAKLEAMEHRIAALMGSKSSSSSSSSSGYKGGDRIPGLQVSDIARLQKENRCFRCKKVGHMKSECPSKPSSKSVN